MDLQSKIGHYSFNIPYLKQKERNERCIDTSGESSGRVSVVNASEGKLTIYIACISCYLQKPIIILGTDGFSRWSHPTLFSYFQHAFNITSVPKYLVLRSIKNWQQSRNWC